VVKSTFASKADMDYYDKECEAHNELKMAIRPVVEDLMTVWFESIFAEWWEAVRERGTTMTPKGEDVTG
jgi:hypothetical protein